MYGQIGRRGFPETEIKKDQAAEKQRGQGKDKTGERGKRRSGYIRPIGCDKEFFKQSFVVEISHGVSVLPFGAAPLQFVAQVWKINKGREPGGVGGKVLKDESFKYIRRSLQTPGRRFMRLSFLRLLPSCRWHRNLPKQSAESRRQRGKYFSMIF